jgi:hypothetical protein
MPGDEAVRSGLDVCVNMIERGSGVIENTCRRTVGAHASSCSPQ